MHVLPRKNYKRDEIKIFLKYYVLFVLCQLAPYLRSWQNFILYFVSGVSVIFHCYCNKVSRSPASEFIDQFCVICSQNIDCEASITVHAKGLHSMIKVATVYRHYDLLEHLISSPTSVKVHDCCYKQYTDSQQLEKVGREKADLLSIPYKRLQSTAASFDFKLGCFY